MAVSQGGQQPPQAPRGRSPPSRLDRRLRRQRTQRPHLGTRRPTARNRVVPPPLVIAHAHDGRQCGWPRRPDTCRQASQTNTPIDVAWPTDSSRVNAAMAEPGGRRRGAAGLGSAPAGQGDRLAGGVTSDWDRFPALVARTGAQRPDQAAATYPLGVGSGRRPPVPGQSPVADGLGAGRASRYGHSARGVDVARRHGVDRGRSGGLGARPVGCGEGPRVGHAPRGVV